MDIYEFLEDRLTWDAASAKSAKEREELAFKRKVLETAKTWPVLLQRPMEFKNVEERNDDMATTISVQLSQRITWLTTKEYIERFGTEAPVSPLIKAMAQIYSYHPSFDPDWRT